MVDGFGTAFGFDESDMARLNLVMEEAVSNIILYAYPQGEVHDIKITADFDSKTRNLNMVISDEGKEFDPTARGEVDISLPAEERQIGGLGIFLVKSIMDSVEYERKDGRNILTLKKRMNVIN